MLHGLLYTLVAISGACGLMYEVVWIRALGLGFGTSTPMIALVTATFMGGLALGNAWLGARADRQPHPLRFYAKLEVAIAVFGASVSFAILRGGVFFDALSRAAEVAGNWAFFVRACVVVLLLLVPATLMGGTLPVLSRALVRRGESGSTVGALYGCNTFGAVAGALLPDFWLIPTHGFSAVVVAAATGNLLVAALALRLSRSWRVIREDSPWEPSAELAPANHALADDALGDKAHAAAPAAQSTTPAAAIALTTLSGFCGMALEVLWSRTISYWTSSLVTSFAVLLAIYLVMLALGAMFTRRVADRTKWPLTTAGLLLCAAGVAVLVGVAFAPEWREFVREVWPHSTRREGLHRTAVAAVLHALYLEGPTCLLLGAAFPFVARTLVDARSSGASSGRLFTMNTLAGVFGSLIAAFSWLPTLGQQDSYLAVALLLAGGGSVAFLAPRRRSKVAFASLGLALALAGPFLLPAGRLARSQFRDAPVIVDLHEGATTSAAAAVSFTFGRPSGLQLLTPGVAMSDTSPGARRYMGVMAHAAMFAADAPKRALLICFGVGNTARSLLSHPDLEQLDVVDISSEVLALAPVFATVQGTNPLADPRTRVFVEDGRHLLVAREQAYDVITAEPPPPNHAGVSNLYSREFYAVAGRRLNQRGVITQWLPMFQLSLTDSRTMISAFVAEFPHTALLYGYSRHFVLIGSLSPLAIDPGRAAQLEQVPSVAADLTRDAIAGAVDLYGSVVMTDAELRALVANDAPLSDNRPSIQYPWEPLAASTDYAALFGRNPARAFALLPQGLGSSELRASIADVASATQHVIDVVDIAGTTPESQARFAAGIARALADRPGDEGLLALLGLDSETSTFAAHALADPGAQELLHSSREHARGLHLSERQDMLRSAAQTLTQRTALNSR